MPKEHLNSIREVEPKIRQEKVSGKDKDVTVYLCTIISALTDERYLVCEYHKTEGLSGFEIYNTEDRGYEKAVNDFNERTRIDIKGKLECIIDDYIVAEGVDAPIAVRDILTDLMHICDDKGCEIDAMIEGASTVYLEEE